MNIVNEKPPIYDKIKFPFDPARTVFTYGNTLYNPSGIEVPSYLIAHEETHSRQQTNPEGWWDRYLKDSQFRFDQELEAYQEEYKFFCKKVKDRNYRDRFLNAIAVSLSGGMYGFKLDFKKVKEAIKDDKRSL